MKIYTKSGDKGETGLFGGERVLKNHPRVRAYGTIDELGAVLALLRVEIEDDYTKINEQGSNAADNLNEALAIGSERIFRIQKELFCASAQIATPNPKLLNQKNLISLKQVEKLEHEIDDMQKDLPALMHFIIPGNNRANALAHLARTVCRRAERELMDVEGFESVLKIYFNRLSDWLFVFSRFCSKINTKKSKNLDETLWDGGMPT